MIQIFNTTFRIALFCFSVMVVCIAVTPHAAHAGKSTQASISDLPALNYFHNNSPRYDRDTVPLDPPRCDANGTSCGWSLGLDAGAVANITYRARLINIETNREIADGATVPVGTQFRIERDTRSLATDIWWTGTGRSIDTPYGRWVNNAGPLPLACNASDFINEYFAPRIGPIRVYTLLNVAPVTPTLTAASANVSCDSSNICTVTNPGRVTVGLRFPTTEGRFYYRYFYENRSSSGYGCRANNVAMSERSGCSGEACLSFPPYEARFPSATILFSLNAGVPNTPPNPPTITPESTNTNIVRQPQTFSFVSTDPDNDQIHYEVDWNNDSIPDSPRMPVRGSVDSGTAQTGAYAGWVTVGMKTFRARALDVHGGVSSWTTATINLSNPVVPTVVTLPATQVEETSATLNGRVTAHDSPTIAYFRYDMTNPGTCNDSFGTRVGEGNFGGSAVRAALTTALSGLSPHTTYYYCALGTNALGTAMGEIQTFTTMNTPPVVTITEPNAGNPTQVDEGETITFDGTVIDQDGDTTFTYEWDTRCAFGGGRLSAEKRFDTTLSPGVHTVYFMAHDGIDISSCDSVEITVVGSPRPDLDPLTLRFSPGPYWVGEEIILSGTAANNGAVDIQGGFSNNFTYAWNTPAPTAWESFAGNAVFHSGLAVSDTVDDQVRLIPSGEGTLYVQYCVDSNGEISESSESNNCLVEEVGTVSERPTGSITANPTIINPPPGTTAITWETEHCPADQVRVQGGVDTWTGVARDTRTSSPIAADVFYTLSCGGILLDDAEVDVPGPDISASPRVVPEGDETMVSWNPNGVPGCVVNGGGLVNVDASSQGSQNVRIDGQTTFTIRCGGVERDRVTVQIIARRFET